MTKSLLVIDTPKSCSQCEIFNFSDLTCLGCKVNFKDIGKVHSCCPLKPIPKKREIISWDKKKYPRYIEWREHLKDLSTDDWEESSRNKGYNACIDKILGENNE